MLLHKAFVSNVRNYVEFLGQLPITVVLAIEAGNGLIEGTPDRWEQHSLKFFTNIRGRGIGNE